MSVRAVPYAARLPIPARRPWLGNLASVSLTASATALWVGSLDRVDLGRMTDVGLVSVLPVSMFVALVLLVFSFLLEMHKHSRSQPLLLLQTGSLIFMLYGVATLLEDVARFQGGWKHVGVADYIIRNGSVDPRIDAYFNWPGFFALIAFVSEVCGFESPMSLVAWAPVAFNVLYFGPLWMIFTSFTHDRRLVWLAMWIFYVTNWIGQDYFSPQALNYFFYLVIIAILLRWFRAPPPVSIHLFSHRMTFEPRVQWPLVLYRWLAPVGSSPTPATVKQRNALLVILLATFAAVVASHQLSPFAALAGVMALVMFNRCSPRWLPIVMVVMVLLWLQFMATTYLAGHGEQLTAQAGSVSTAVGANLTNRFTGSEGHKFVVYMRIGMTLGLWAVALLGMVRRLRNGYHDMTVALLGAAPFPLVVAQPYGGEMLLRVYLFSLPFVAFFVAALIYPVPRFGEALVHPVPRLRSTPWATVTSGVMIVVLLTGFLFIRFGNERMDHYTSEEVAATRYLYSVAPAGSVLIGGTTNTPWKDRDYEVYRYRSLTNELAWDDATVADPVGAIAAAMHNAAYPATYLIITRSQIAGDDLFLELPVPLGEIEPMLEQSVRFSVIYSNDDATIFVLA